MGKIFTSLCFLFFISTTVLGADYYWVGGGGNWSDLNHWRLGSSSGSIPSIVPSAADNVFFNENSGFGTTVTERTVVLDANGFCRNMSWGAVANNPIFNRTGAYKVEIWGNLELSPTVNYTTEVIFRGSTAATLTTNGTVQNVLGIEINKPGAALSLVDSLVVTNLVSTSNNIQITAGTLNVSGKKVSTVQFNSFNTSNRTLIMDNADIRVSYRWDFRGTNKTISAAGSRLYSEWYLFTDGGTYHNVESNGASSIHFGIDNTTFSKFTFVSASSGSAARINLGNTIDSLIFLGQGQVFPNNTIGYLRFNMVGNIVGSGNNIHKAEAYNNFTISEASATNTFDSLLLAANKVASFNGTVTINQHLKAVGAACDAYTELVGEANLSLIFGAGATTNIENVLLAGMKASGPIIPIAVEGIDGEGNIGFTITEPTTIGGTTLYWVGGAGEWNDKMHWSYTSGGAGGACIPFINDNVIFNAASGLAAGNIITTNGNTFCHDITWDAALGAITFNESSSARLRIYGSASLNPAVTMNATLEFSGTDPASTITMNGSTAGNLSILVKKTGAGTVTLEDNWMNTAGNIILTSGELILEDRTLTIFSFTSNQASTRSLNIINANILVSDRWEFTALNKTMQSTGSYIKANNVFSVDGGLTYPLVDLSYGGNINTTFNIRGTYFGHLSFTAPSASGSARILSNNTIRKLSFLGAGSIAEGGNKIDSLILEAAYKYLFTGSTTINEYLEANATTCGGMIEMRGNPTATLVFGAGVSIDMQNVYLANITATGIAPIAFNGADAGGNTGWIITPFSGTARYWVGGSGDWNDASHWSLTSGGTGGACIPTVFDDVYFDAASGFTAGNKTVTVNNGNAFCRNLNWAGATNSPIWNKAAGLIVEAWGENIILNPTASFNLSSLTIKGPGAATMQGTVLGNFDIIIDKPSGGLTLLNDYTNIQTDIQLVNGEFNASGRAIHVNSIDNNSLNNPMRIDISNANITTDLRWRYDGPYSNRTLDATDAVINSLSFLANGLAYDVVNVSGTANSNAQISGTAINRLTFTNPSTSSAAGIFGNNNAIQTVDYKGGGGVYGTGNIIDTLIFFPGNTYTFNGGTNNTITGAWYGSGTPCRLTEIVSSNTTNATITKNGSGISFDYVRLRRITAAGNAGTFTAGEHSTDMGDNINWDIAPYNGTQPITGLGDDLVLSETDFPYLLTTEGFFGAPGAVYIWNDNSTASSLEITEPGLYSVSVTFPDGCHVSDEILITAADVLPVTLTRFNAVIRDCKALVSWEVSDAVNFSHIVVQRSYDGFNFSDQSKINFESAISKYAYIDESGENGRIFYRLKLVDIDGRYEYSKIIPVIKNCAGSEIRIYPVITSSSVQVSLPIGFENAGLQLLNLQGQKLGGVVRAGGSVRAMSLGHLPAGTYLIQVINRNEVKTFKVIKK